MSNDINVNPNKNNPIFADSKIQDMSAQKLTEIDKPILRKAQEEIVRCQVERFRTDYHQYFELEETQRLVKFFFERIYDLEAQDTIIQVAINTYLKVKRQLSEQVCENLDNLIELNRLTHALDRRMAELLLKNGWKEGEQLNKEEYFKIYKELGFEAERREQLASSLKCIMMSYHFAHHHYNQTLLKIAKGIALIFGLSALYRFIEEGYLATYMVTGSVFDKIIENVTEVELAYIDDAFGS